MKFLLSTPVYNQAMQNSALALHEAGALAGYYSLGVDHFHSLPMRLAREFIRHNLPTLDRELLRRRVTLVPNQLVYSDWSWESLRTIANRFHLNLSLQDWLWERSEYRLDRGAAWLIRENRFEAFMGTEYSSLEALKVATHLRKPTVLNFLSPHYSAKQSWVDPEYQSFPELLTPAAHRLMRLASERGIRRDAEAKMADVIVTNSKFTTQTLVDAGVSSSKIITVPHGAITTISDEDITTSVSVPMRFMYAGNVSILKGVHYLLRAWEYTQKDLGDAELHIFGLVDLPKPILSSTPSKVYYHGSVTQSELFQQYKRSSVLVFPTLLDGFGMVVSEAMAHGLPVITTPNAGAADLIEEGKNGFLVPAKNIEALSERLVWCVEHPVELLTMRIYALQTARRQTWEKVRAEFREKLAAALGVSLL